MDKGPDQREDDVTRTDVPVTRPEPTGPATDRVRIVGAEPAGESTSEVPAVPGSDGSSSDAGPVAGVPSAASLPGPDGPGPDLQGAAGQPGQTVDPVVPGQTAMPTGAGAPTELPHWTEPPTGQVPAVLARSSGDEGAGPDSGIIPPSWREEHADWAAHDEEFEPSIFGGDHVSLGSLDETDDSQVERRPWEFDLDSGTREPVAGPITEPVEAVGNTSPDRPGRGAGVAPLAAAGVRGAGEPGAGAAGDIGAGVDADDTADRGVQGAGEPVETAAAAHAGNEEVFDLGTPKPTGSPPRGRARRNGLLPGRLRAKRPVEADARVDPPLAAEPPGSSVTDVPGVVRRRGGVAGLAAADRTAERDGEPDGVADELGGVPGSNELDDARPASATVAAGVRTARHRPRRRSTMDRRGAGVSTAATGGGPPVPRRSGRPMTAQQQGRDSRENGSGIGLRVGTGMAVAVIALLAFKLGTVTSVVLVAIVVTFAAGECFSVLRRAGYHPATLLGLVGTVSLVVGAYTKGVAALPLVMVLITVFTLIWYLFGVERGSPVAGTAATLLTVGWVSLLGSFAGLLLSPSTFPDRHGIAFLLGAIIATVANDVGALVIGGWLGSRPLAPTISPNKTWEGLLGGAVFSILLSTVLVGAIHPWTAANAALLGAVVAVVAPLGDLCESLLKRDLRLKDMGTLLPGHGGILDRVDALLFVLPATYYLVRALNIG